MIFLNGKFSLTAKEFQVFEDLYNKANIQLLKSHVFSDVHFKITVSPILCFFFLITIRNSSIHYLSKSTGSTCFIP